MTTENGSHASSQKTRAALARAALNVLLGLDFFANSAISTVEARGP